MSKKNTELTGRMGEAARRHRINGETITTIYRGSNSFNVLIQAGQSPTRTFNLLRESFEPRPMVFETRCSGQEDGRRLSRKGLHWI